LDVRSIHVTSPSKRCRSDRLYPRTLGPRELEALRLVDQRPGITIAELADELGVTMWRVWQIVGWLEAGLGRQLTAADFPDDVPMNSTRGVGAASVLQARLGAV
jgi:hypothetical protein